MVQVRSRPQLVLHAGLQKTGTSSIQLMLNAAKTSLAENGYHYPDLPASEDRSRTWVSPFRHNVIAATYGDFLSTFETMTPQEADAFWTALRENPLTPILSAEEFSRIKNFGALAERLAEFDVHVIVYLRRQDKFAESLYNQRNKLLLQRGDDVLLTQDLLSESALFAFLKQEKYIQVLNFKRLLTEIERQLAPARITVRNFDRSFLTGGDVCLDFWSTLDLPAEQFVKLERQANDSVSNLVMEEFLEPLRRDEETEARAALKALSDRVRDNKIASGDYSILSAPTRRQMLAQFEEINAFLQARYDLRFN